MDSNTATAQLSGPVWRRIVIVAALVSTMVGAHRPPEAGMGLRESPALTNWPGDATARRTATARSACRLGRHSTLLVGQRVYLSGSALY